MVAKLPRSEPLLLQVDGMYCVSCARALQAVLDRLPGVASAQVAIASSVASIELLPHADRAAVLSEAISASIALGYPAQPWSPVALSTPASTGDLPARLAIGVFLGMWVMAAQVALYTGQVQSLEEQLLLAKLAGLAATPIVFGAGSNILKAGWRTLRAKVPGMDALVSLGSVGAWSLSMAQLLMGSPEVWFDSAAMLIVFLILGRLVEGRVRAQGADAVRALLALAPPTAQVFREGAWVEAKVASLVFGERIRVRPHTDLSVDAEVLEGSSHLDTSSLSGESRAVLVAPGDAIFAGTQNLEGTLEARVTAGLGERRIDQIAKQVRQALDQRTQPMGLDQRLAELWFPIVLVLSVIALGIGLWATSWDQALLRALSVLVITCPCALSIASPLVSAVAIGRAAKKGILFRDPGALRGLAEVEALSFDKTGTLTEGRPQLVGVDVVAEQSEARVLELAGLAESESEHPLARALHREGPVLPGRFIEHPGLGVEWIGPQGHIKVGARGFFSDLPLPASATTEAWLSQDGVLLGRLRFEDTLRPEAPEVVRRLSQRFELELLSGDASAPVEQVAEALNISAARAGCSPEDKAAHIRATQHKVLFVGDGVNDAPALASAHIGMAVGAASDPARASAAVVLAGGGLERVEQALDIARRAHQDTRGALIWAAVYNGVALPMAMAGLVRPHWAVLAMLASSLSITWAVLRPLRARP